MSLYQFLVAVRQGEAQTNLTNEAGEVTSHIQGFLSRTVKMMELGIKPVYVFDGKPPELKSEELKSRDEKKKQAETELAAGAQSLPWQARRPSPTTRACMLGVQRSSRATPRRSASRRTAACA